MGHLEGKRAVVTGSSQGIGRAVALRLAREGASVVINGTGSVPGMLEGVAEEIRAAGGRAVPVIGSVADPEVGKRLVQTCVEEFGGIDTLINVAGISGRAQHVLTVSQEVWHEQIDVHLHGTFYTIHEAAPLMAAQGHGTIVNTSSHAFVGNFGGTGYGAAKAATNSLTYELAYDLKDHGIRVNAIAPGAKTQMSSGPAYEAGIRDLEARGVLDASIIRRETPGPEHVASLYTFLASDLSAPITGRVFSGSGGYVGWFENPVDRKLATAKFSEGETWSLEQLSEALLARPELTAALATSMRPDES